MLKMYHNRSNPKVQVPFLLLYLKQKYIIVGYSAVTYHVYTEPDFVRATENCDPHSTLTTPSPVRESI